MFYYFEKGVEHGPVSKAELSALIRSSQVNIFQRIETSIAVSAGRLKCGIWSPDGCRVSPFNSI